MKIHYDRNEDVLMLEISDEGKIDHAEQVDSVIVHFTASGEPVLLEILDASEFLSAIIKATMRPEKEALA
jgi:uncharacterized protein YuzE